MRSLTVLRAIAKPTSLASTPARRPQTFQTLGSGRASTHYLRVSRLLAILLESTFSSSVAASCLVHSYLVRRALTLLPTSLSSPFRCASLREKQHEFLPASPIHLQLTTTRPCRSTPSRWLCLSRDTTVFYPTRNWAFRCRCQ